MLRLNRGIVKIALRSGGGMEQYRYYAIARRHFELRSGMFSLDELCDELHDTYGYKSLHRGPGNDRTRYKRRIAALLGASELFSRAGDGRYIARSERKLLSRHTGGSRSGWFEVPDPEVLASKKAFYDFCVGVLLAGNRFRANRNISAFCGCTVRRIQYATARNHKQSHFTKQYNFIDDFTGTYEDVQRCRAVLLNVHGITSPLPSRCKGGWVLRLNAPNSYRASVLSGVKGDRAQPTIRKVQKEENWFIPFKERDKQLRLFDEPPKRWFFNERVYNADRYVQDHSSLL